MEVQKTIDGGKMTLKVKGRLDTNTSQDLEAELVLDGINEVVFDLAELEYISSSGLRVLMLAQKTMTACGGKVLVASPNTVVKSVLDITGMSSIFTVI